MNNNRDPAIVGQWKDYTTGERLVSVPDPWGIVAIVLAGIWLSWSTKYIKKIAGNVALWYHLRQHRESRESGSPYDAVESTSLLRRNSRKPGKRDAQTLARIYKEKSGIRDLFADVFVAKELCTEDRLRLLAFVTSVIVLASGLIVSGYFLTKIRVDGPARLASEKCGLWLFEDAKRSGAATRARVLDLEREERAAQFAEDCYGLQGSASSRCKVLYRPALPVSKAIYTNDCPFASDICLVNQTVTFKTPIVDGRDLGINSPSSPKFHRSTACTPLSMDFPYVQNKTKNGTTTYTYHYGTKLEGDHLVNHTYMTVGNHWDRLPPMYDLFAYSSNAGNSAHPVWTPHPSLIHPRYSTLTIVFISSLRLLYEEHSNDPIFPADEDYFLPGDPRPWFRNSDPRARPLACIDTIEVCTPDGKWCWNINKPTGNETTLDNSPEFILLYSSLYRTDIYYSMVKRQGRSLLAQKKVSQYFSTSLGIDPWVAEVENWVWTALARTSINAWSVASGEDSVHEGKDGFVEITRGSELCGIYKYNPMGYQTLRLVPFVLVFLWLPSIWILARDGEPIARKLKEPLSVLVKPVDNAVMLLRKRGSILRKELSCNGTTTPTPGSVITATVTGIEQAALESPNTSYSPTATTTAQQPQASQPLETEEDIVQMLTVQNPEPLEDEQNDVEWESLFLWQLIYCLWFLLSRTSLILALIFCLPLDLLLGWSATRETWHYGRRPAGKAVKRTSPLSNT